MNRLIAFIVGAACAALAAKAAAYQEVTHDSITRQAVDRSIVNDSQKGPLQGLFLGDNPADSRYRLPKSGTPDLGIQLTPKQLIAAGVREEDEQDRPLNHFFDPQQSGIPLTVAGREWGAASPAWALEDGGQIEGQEFSYGDAADYLFTALSGPTELERQRSLGRMFEALGHVVHHLQDMTQPQHVRNDDHCDETVPFFIFSVGSFYYASASRCEAVGRYQPSAYEQYVRELDALPFGNYPVPAAFDTPHRYWQNAGAGLAEFTSNNFVTVDTNFSLDTSTRPLTIASEGKHAWPRGSDARLVDIDINDPGLIRRVTSPDAMAGDISFVETPVVDLNAPEFSGPNRASSMLSIWYDSVRLSSGEVQATGYPVFSLNGINYQAAAERLIPRAAAYSTGLINYFFRGRIEIGLPADGVYGVIDHATTYAAGQGFGKLKLRLRNASPDGVKPDGTRVPQTMEGGTLVAIAKYTLNSCYMPDLTGDFVATLDTGVVIYPYNCTLDQYFAGEEQIAQSAAMLGATLTPTATDFEFDFGSQPIPVNARDLRIQVLYTGQLGAEADGIAFGGRDISEPTHVVVYNNSDYYAVDGKFYTPAEIRSDPTLTQRTQGQVIDPRALRDVSLAFASGRFVAGPSTQPVGVNGYLRVAVLAERDQTFNVSVRLRFEGGSLSTSTFAGIIPATIELRDEIAFITPLGLWRGMRAHMVDVAYRAADNVPLGENELAVMSTRDLADPGPTQIPVGF